MAHAARSHSASVQRGGTGDFNKNDLADCSRDPFRPGWRISASREAASSTRRSFASEKISAAFATRSCDHRRIARRAITRLRPGLSSIAERVARILALAYWVQLSFGKPASQAVQTLAVPRAIWR